MALRGSITVRRQDLNQCEKDPVKRLRVAEGIRALPIENLSVLLGLTRW